MLISLSFMVTLQKHTYGCEAYLRLKTHTTCSMYGNTIPVFDFVVLCRTHEPKVCDYAIKVVYHLLYFSSETAKSTLTNIEEKRRDLTQSYDKSPYTHRKTKTTRQHKKCHQKNFDYTTISGRLRTVSWSNS